jgi:hypothetical protein
MLIFYVYKRKITHYPNTMANVDFIQMLTYVTIKTNKNNVLIFI